MAMTAQWFGFPHAWIGGISMLLILFPSSPGIKEPHRRADDAKPCQKRRIRLREQPTGKNRIDDGPDKVDEPGNLALWFQR